VLSLSTASAPLARAISGRICCHEPLLGEVVAFSGWDEGFRGWVVLVGGRSKKEDGETGSRRALRARAGSRRGQRGCPVLQEPVLGAADGETSGSSWCSRRSNCGS
jgi:hypothetical protein